MTLVSSIIQDAYRESNIIALGKTPTDGQGTEALRLFNAAITALYGNDAGEKLRDWPLGNFDRPSDVDALPYTVAGLSHPRMNTRLIAVNDAAMTVGLWIYPEDGARYAILDPFGRLAAVPITLDGGGRLIEGAPTLLLNVNGTARQWFYRADLGNWVRLTGLTADMDAPFPEEFDQFFITLLAIRLNPRFGREMDAQSQMIFKASRTQFVNRYLQSAPLETDDSISWPFMSYQSYDTQRSFSSTPGWARGYVGQN